MKINLDPFLDGIQGAPQEGIQGAPQEEGVAPSGPTDKLTPDEYMMLLRKLRTRHPHFGKGLSTDELFAALDRFSATLESAE